MGGLPRHDRGLSPTALAQDVRPAQRALAGIAPGSPPPRSGVAEPVTSYRWCTGSCMKYLANVSTVNEAPSLRRPGRSHSSPARAAKRAAIASAAAASSAGDGRGVLGVVAVRERGLVLVPVRVKRVVLGQHQAEPVVIQPEHIAHVAAVLERRPLVRPGPPRRVRARRAEPARRPRWPGSSPGPPPVRTSSCQGRTPGMAAAAPTSSLSRQEQSSHELTLVACRPSVIRRVPAVVAGHLPRPTEKRPKIVGLFSCIWDKNGDSFPLWRMKCRSAASARATG